MRYVHALRLSFPDPDGVAAFLCAALSYEGGPRADGAWFLENGALALVIVAGASRNPTLEVWCDDIAVERADLQKIVGVAGSGDIVRVAARLECAVHTDFGLTLLLVKPLDEDDLGELPPLPTSLEWTSDADLLVRRILTTVPVAFRDKARARVTEQAEYLAVEAGKLCVERAAALQGLWDSTLAFQHDKLRAAMLSEGVEMSELPRSTEEPQ